MKIVLAFDSFKGSLSSSQAVSIAYDAIKACDPTINVEKMPLCDGGEGTAQVLTRALGGEFISVAATDALMRPVSVEVGVVGNHVFLDIASVVGLAMLSPEERSPLRTTTYGVGALVDALLKKGFASFTIGLGGSSTNDCGLGFLQALGAICYDGQGVPFRRPITGALLHLVDRIDLSLLESHLSEINFDIISDVCNPLCGEHGAAYVFAPQKGASLAEVRYLDRGLSRIADLLYEGYGRNIRDVQFAGAAGGMGAVARLLPNAKFYRGIDFVLDTLDFSSRFADADFIFFGEGSFDAQSLMGKAFSGIADRIRFLNSRNVKQAEVVVFAGSISGCGLSHMPGLHSVHQITPSSMPLSEALRPDIARRNLASSVSSFLQSLKS